MTSALIKEIKEIKDDKMVYDVIGKEISTLEQINSVLIEKYKLEVKEITFGPIKKNILLKNKLMKKKFGLFKSIVYRTMQYTSFVKFLNYIDQSKTLFNGITHIIDILHIRLLEYINITTDIWFPTKRACRVKVFDIYMVMKNHMIRIYHMQNI